MSDAKKIPVEVKASFWYVVCSVIQKGMSIITIPIFTRIMSQAEYGQVSVYTAWLGLFSIILTLNLPFGSFQTAMIKYEQKRDDYIASVEGVILMLSAVFLAVYLPFTGTFNSLLNMSTPVVLVMVFEIAASSFTQCWMGKQKFEYKYKSVIAITLIIAVLSQGFALTAVFLFKDKGTAKIMANALIVVIFGLAIGGYFLVKSKKLFNKEFWKFALGFNIPLLAYYLSQVVFNQSDKIMIEKICGEGDAGVYDIAYKLGTILTFVVTAITSSYMPWFYRKLKNKKEIEDRTVSLVLSAILALLLFLVIACAPEAVYILGGNDYSAAAWAVPPVAASTLLLFYADIFDRVFFFFENKVYLTVAAVAAGGVNIGLNFIFIPMYGFVAAAYTTLASYLILAVLDFVFSLIVLKQKGRDTKIYNVKGLAALF
ncbi:MAG: oligosaccharide flippase family protein, partial [Clostridia bacterium]|nr:oligosaccharide flippase family protein [Clostridia bacterium]